MRKYAHKDFVGKYSTDFQILTSELMVFKEFVFILANIFGKKSKKQIVNVNYFDYFHCPRKTSYYITNNRIELYWNGQQKPNECI